MIHVAVWHAGQVVSTSLVPEGTSDREIREKMISQSNILCDRPFETPYERNVKIRMGRIKRYSDNRLTS